MVPRTTKHQTWLYKLFNSTYFDTWMCVSYMYRYPETGIHHYICGKLENRPDIYSVLPQLIHVMFHHSKTTISYPIYDLIKKICANRSIAMRVYFLLDTYRESMDEKRNKWCELIMEYVLKCKKKGDVVKQRLNKIIDKNSYIEYSNMDSEANNNRILLDDTIIIGNITNERILIKDSIVDNSILNNDSIIIDESVQIDDKYLKHKKKDYVNKKNKNVGHVTYNLGRDKDNETSGNKTINTIQINSGNSLIGNKNIKEMYKNVPIVDKINEIITEGIGNNKKKTDKKRVKYKMNRCPSYKNHPLRLLTKHPNLSPTIESILITFIKNISYPFHSTAIKLKQYESQFQQENREKFKCKTSFKKNVEFLKNLVAITGRLKNLSKPFQQTALKIECNEMLLDLPDRISLPFDQTKFIISIRTEHCFVLNSAINAPYVIVFETANELPTVSVELTEETNVSILLFKQSRSLTMEMKQIRESIVDKINGLSIEGGKTYISKKAFKEKYESRYKPKKQENKALPIENDDVGMKYISKSNNNNETVMKIFDIPLENKLKINDSGKYCNEEKIMLSKNNLNDKDNTNEQTLNKIVSNDVLKGNELNQAINKEGIEKSKNKCDELSITENDKTNFLINDFTDWQGIISEIETSSKYRHLKGYRVVSLIVKSGYDFKQELLAYQLLTEIKRIWKEEDIKAWIRNYEIYLVNKDSGLVETVLARSVHCIKKSCINKKISLVSFYEEKFKKIKKAKLAFLESLVGYSVVTYLLQLKDRHNGNILIDEEGHLVHVDFGFILGEHPGFYNVEKAPFKFSSEYSEILANDLTDFRCMFYDAFYALRKHADRICGIIEMLQFNSGIRCINKNSIAALRERFKLDLTSVDLIKHINLIVDLSVRSVTTGFYDSFQYYSQGYY